MDPTGPEWMTALLALERCGSRKLCWSVFQQLIQVALSPLTAGIWWRSVSRDTLADMLKSKVTTVGLNGRPASLRYITLGLFGSEVERWEDDLDDQDDVGMMGGSFEETDLRHPGRCAFVPATCI